ncbi:MAG TPA: hypothetical protein VLA74_12405 [Nitrososphaeraceae archaeon]|nr:hypothetical protein [Nitrososphaeraceae archaeon]
MNIDKTIKDLSSRLDEVHPYSASTSNEIKNDGITYWKGKKIISTKAWNDLYEKSSTYTDTYKITLASRKPLQYFPDDYNSQISITGIKDEKLKEEIQQWNKDYYELLEYRKNPTLGRMKCTKCVLSGSNDDPIFVGIEKVFARIVTNQCNNNINTHSNGFITYHCSVMNLFSCPFESIKSYNEKPIESKYPYKREDLFTLHQLSFAIEQAITTFSEITKNNEIIYEVDFEKDRFQEIHTKYNGEPESWGWNDNVEKQLAKVQPISPIQIRNEQDIYNILTDREKLEYLLQEYEKKYSHQLDEEKIQHVCCDENTPCVHDDDSNNNNNKVVSSTLTTSTTTDTLAAAARKKQQQIQNQEDYSHKGENRHSKNNTSEEGLDNEKLISILKTQIKEDELEEQEKEQKIFLKENRQNIIDFIIENKDVIRIEDLKIYGSVYKCYREKGNCNICNMLTNIICINCNNYKNKEVWLCTNHWKEYVITYY